MSPSPGEFPEDEPGTVAVGAATAIFDLDGRVLLVRHTYGRRNWELPGGLALPGEDPATTARRELREETGLALPAGILTGLYFEAAHRLGPFLHVLFRVEAPLDVAPEPSSSEVDAAEFWALDSLPRPLSDFTARRIEDALSHGGAAFAVVQPRRWLG
jgi:8-oxo-dGTP pyrophosphatase MutT (NUDIX family)